MSQPEYTPRLELVRELLALIYGDPARSLADLWDRLNLMQGDTFTISQQLGPIGIVAERFGTLADPPDEVFFTTTWPAYVRAALGGIYTNNGSQLAQLSNILAEIGTGQEIAPGRFSGLPGIATTLHNLWLTSDEISTYTGETVAALETLIAAQTTAAQAQAAALSAQAVLLSQIGDTLDQLLACCLGQSVQPGNPAPDEGSYCGEWIRCTGFTPAGTVFMYGITWTAYTPVFPLEGLPTEIAAGLRQDLGRRIYYRQEMGSNSVCFGWNVVDREVLPLLVFREETTPIGGTPYPPLTDQNLIPQFVSETQTGSVSWTVRTLSQNPPIEGDVVTEMLLLYQSGQPEPTNLDFFIGGGAAPA